MALRPCICNFLSNLCPLSSQESCLQECPGQRSIDLARLIGEKGFGASEWGVEANWLDTRYSRRTQPGHEAGDFPQRVPMPERLL